MDQLSIVATTSSKSEDTESADGSEDPGLCMNFDMSVSLPSSGSTGSSPESIKRVLNKVLQRQVQEQASSQQPKDVNGTCVRENLTAKNPIGKPPLQPASKQDGSSMPKQSGKPPDGFSKCPMASHSPRHSQRSTSSQRARSNSSSRSSVDDGPDTSPRKIPGSYGDGVIRLEDYMSSMGWMSWSSSCPPTFHPVVSGSSWDRDSQGDRDQEDTGTQSGSGEIRTPGIALSDRCSSGTGGGVGTLATFPSGVPWKYLHVKSFPRNVS